MKELTKFELAAVKRTAANVKIFRTKKAKYETEKEEYQKEIDALNQLIDAWEAPVIAMTGKTSEEILSQLNSETPVETSATEETSETTEQTQEPESTETETNNTNIF